jgi:hypothetical protein
MPPIRLLEDTSVLFSLYAEILQVVPFLQKPPLRTEPLSAPLLLSIRATFPTNVLRCGTFKDTYSCQPWPVHTMILN